VLNVAGRGGVPADAKTVVVTLTATNVTAAGFITGWYGGSRPATSDLNLLPGSTVANLAVIPLSSTGTISLYNLAGHTDLIADVLGYYR
ncbi:MAG: hypothetical protein JWM02_264, partial [Frankiales bacterium]|nr:hypothetical protein [Frankiales bacterium]